MAPRCNGGGGGCSVSTTFMRTKEAKWRSAQWLSCAKIEGEMGEHGPEHGTVWKEGVGGWGVDRRVEL
jgi:hypothetical protein